MPAAASESPPLAPELAEHIGFVLAKARERFFASLEPIFAGYGLGGREFGVLVMLSRRGAMRQTDLADALRIDRTTIMNTVDSLQTAALIGRHPYPGDRRAYEVRITAAGEKMIRRMLPALAEAEDRFLARLDSEERKQLLALLSRLVLE